MPPTSTLPRRADARRNRADILTAATAAVAVDPRASLGDIARIAGLSRRALYGHFDDREALVREVIRGGAARFDGVATAAGGSSADPRLALARMAALLWTEKTQTQIAATIALGDSYPEAVDAALASVRARLHEIVAAGQASGDFRDDTSSESLCRFLEETVRTIVTRFDDPVRAVAIRTLLGVAGVSWRDAAALLDAHPELDPR